MIWKNGDQYVVWNLDGNGNYTSNATSAVSGAERVHLCGAYRGWGFHEDGVASAARVARDLGGRRL